MCGIAGYILKKESPPSRHISLFLEGIRRRGPDDEGVCLITRFKNILQCYTRHEKLPTEAWHDVCLIHTRYAIIDLSDGGRQPFVSQDGSIAAVFNGEIYNYLELKDELRKEGVSFRSASDTEVLVEGYARWREKLWEKLNGFWAVVLYDKKSRSVVFSRDRIGVAPLYYRETKEALFFCSYIQPLIDVSPESVHIHHDVYLGFIQTGIKDHRNTTYYKEIKSFPAASYVHFQKDEWRSREAGVSSYWNLPETRLRPQDVSLENAAQKLRDVLFSAVELRLRSDVKVAFELSGGLDSSSVVAAAAGMSKDVITTYTVKIKDADEEPYARAMRERYHLDYRVLDGIEEDFVRDHEWFSSVMEEPYDNPNDYTHHRMLQRMKEEGTHVVVTGAGGDEVLAGYESAFWPGAYRALRKAGVASFIKADWHEFCRRFKTSGDALKMLRHYTFGPWQRLQRLAASGEKRREPLLTEALNAQNRYPRLSFHEQQQFHFKTALVPYYMRSSDHFTMGIPIEHRFPLLDYRVVEFGLKMPLEYLFHNGWSKYVLRKAMEPFLPKKILWRRKKMGFTFPYRTFFADQKQAFQPHLDELYDRDRSLKDCGSYEDLLETDAHLLWRLLSTAIWCKTNRMEFNAA